MLKAWLTSVSTVTVAPSWWESCFLTVLPAFGLSSLWALFFRILPWVCRGLEGWSIHHCISDAVFHNPVNNGRALLVGWHSCGLLQHDANEFNSGFKKSKCKGRCSQWLWYIIIKSTTIYSDKVTKLKIMRLIKKTILQVGKKCGW